jgi:hypothetical protein
MVLVSKKIEISKGRFLMTTQLKAIIEDGFNFDTKESDSVDLALISLRTALYSYFSTYQTFQHRLHIFLRPNSQEDVDFNHSNDYCERCADCIVHFQHFAELVCKSFLRRDHPLLSDIASGNANIVHKLLHGKSLSTDEQAGVQSIEFSVALDRLSKLIKSKQLRDFSDAEFILKYKEALEQLNKLRNRVWHRGLYILRYQALDKFIGQFILPFVKEVLSHPHYANSRHVALYAQPSCKIDPIDEIIKHFISEPYSVKKVAFLKELGRAAYDNPLALRGKPSASMKSFLPSFFEPDRRRAEKIATTLAQAGDEIDTCPVCGIRSLIILEDMESYTEEDGETEHVYTYTHTADCANCGFQINAQDTLNASGYGFSEIRDYWR